MMADDDKDDAEPDEILEEARLAFAEAEEAEHDNRVAALDDLKFSRLGEQWPSEVLELRKNRIHLTINKMPAFIRQVVNDARQNKPSIKVHPVDSGADKETADIFNGLIRNIEYTSSADIAYDTATEGAVGTGFGYFRFDLEYSHEDTFDLDIRIGRIANQFSIYRDPMSTAADSSDWNSAFEVEILSKRDFEKKYKGAAKVDWDADGYNDLADPWCTDDAVQVAGWWTRDEYEKQIYLLSDGTVQSKEQMDVLQDLFAAQGITVAEERTAKCYRVRRRLLTGAEMLEDEKWPGQYIPIVPVYGDEVDVKGKRHFRSLIRDAKDAQRMFNYWRTMTTELVALAPKTPFIGPKGAFKTDAAKWATANTENHSYIEYDPAGGAKPERQPFVGVPAGPMQEALNASDDMKAIMGLYDASLGRQHGDQSGRAISLLDRQGDVSTFHFQDNMARAIRHGGRIAIDLIQKVYTKARIVRIISEDGTQTAQQINQQTPVTDKQGQPVMDDQTGQAMTRVYSLTAGKYDLTVTTGPSFTTKRQEAAEQMTEMVRAFPAAAPVIGDLIAKNLDWPGADEIAERLKSINPALQQQGGGIPPEVQQQIQEGMQRLQELEQENQQLKADKQIDMAKLQLDAQKLQVEAEKAKTDQFRADTERANPKPVPKLQISAGKSKPANGDGGEPESDPGADIVSAIMDGMQQVAKSMAMPKRVVKNQAGEIVGVEPFTPPTLN